ncbi:MAG: tRNA pseudouridine(55) synthase TruB [Ardenticatenia bacterium]|nr:tRNA pseudouridine(55) synthase TruB [Ardenticatenia bacterium]
MNRTMSPQQRRVQLDGLLIVDKPAGITSHDVVERVRRLSRQRRVGHAGTLDPLATGVLVLGLGRTTRLLEYMASHDKRYWATVRLGVSTTTYDAEGEITAHYEGPWPSLDAVEAALEEFVGEIEQRPPAFSAIKRGGERLYKKARRGEQVDIAPRRVIVHTLRLMSYVPPTLHLEITCSKGTYIRSLAHDLGQVLGTGAHLAALRRMASGPFTLDDAHTLEELDTAARARRLHELLRPPDAGLVNLLAIDISPEQARRVAHGQPVSGPPPTTPGQMARIRLNGRLLAVAEYDERRGAWQPRKVFVSVHEVNPAPKRGHTPT